MAPHRQPTRPGWLRRALGNHASIVTLTPGNRAHSGDSVGRRARGPEAHKARVQASSLPSYLGFLEGRDGPKASVGSRVIWFILLLAHFGHGWEIEGAETRRQARWGQVVGGGRLSGTLTPFSRDCPPMNPSRNPPRQSDAPLPGAGGESSQVEQ